MGHALPDAREFFDAAQETMRDDMLLVLAERDGEYVAGALNFIGRDTLYGRYWGCSEHHPALHFELCYYRAIDLWRRRTEDRADPTDRHRHGDGAGRAGRRITRRGRDVDIRDATPDDIPAIGAVLRRLTAAGKRTRPDGDDHVRDHYIEDAARILCAVAVDGDGTVLGFQSLRRAAAGNPWGVTPGWGMVGTHIDPGAARRGVGRALFAATREAAVEAGLRDVDASIGAENAEGLAYYEAMGFRDYRTSEGRICKRWRVTRWAERDGGLEREFRFADFAEAWGFMSRVALLAERADHHPVWRNSWNRGPHPADDA